MVNIYQARHSSDKIPLTSSYITIHSLVSFSIVIFTWIFPLLSDFFQLFLFIYLLSSSRRVAEWSPGSIRFGKKLLIALRMTGVIFQPNCNTAVKERCICLWEDCWSPLCIRRGILRLKPDVDSVNSCRIWTHWNLLVMLYLLSIRKKTSVTIWQTLFKQLVVDFNILFELTIWAGTRLHKMSNFWKHLHLLYHIIYKYSSSISAGIML